MENGDLRTLIEHDAAMERARQRPDQLVHIYRNPEWAGVSVKVHHSTTGVSLEVDVKRGLLPTDPEERARELAAYESARQHAVAMMVATYTDAESALKELGLTLGKAQGAK